ncbi:MAG: hypothetical protein EYC70_02215 [Planctomycetota bacterium]|nr:MAG: hypothetical protein EYC70_02215 [Planctomycetota bacterium]
MRAGAAAGVSRRNVTLRAGMTETFELQGKDSAPKRRPAGTWVVLGLLGLGVTALVVKTLFNHGRQLGTGSGDELFQQAQARTEAFARILPEGRVPDPFYLRGAAAAGTVQAVWMRSDFDDAHVLLIAAPATPSASALEEMLQSLGGERMPARQIIDEPGVLPEKRPPFQEEYRTPAPPGEDVHPPRGWTAQWEEAARFDPPQDGGISIELQIDAEQSFRLSPWRQEGPYWWTVVDLGSKSAAGELYLVHFTRAQLAPSAGPVHDFVSALLRVR